MPTLTMLTGMDRAAIHCAVQLISDQSTLLVYRLRFMHFRNTCILQAPFWALRTRIVQAVQRRLQAWGMRVKENEAPERPQCQRYRWWGSRPW